MEELGKERLKTHLADRLRPARNELLQVEIDISLWTAAVELWSQLNETEELQTAAAKLAVKQEYQRQLKALINRLEMGLEFLLR